MRGALDLAFAIGCVLAVWMGLLVLLAGLGRGLLRLTAGRSAEAPDLATAAWAGYAATIAILQIWHFALPVDGRALAILVILSAAGWWAGRSSAALSGDRLPRAVLLTLGLALGSAAIWLADRSIGPCFSYDSANYQIPLVRWYHSYPLVPGLANLNPLYGHNPSGLLFAALLERGTTASRSHHFTSGFLLFLLLLVLARFLGDLFGRTSRPGSRHAVALTLLFPTVMLMNRGAGNWISSHATDLPVAAAVFAAWCFIAAEIDDLPKHESARPGPRLVTGLALFVVAPCLKASAAVFAATAWVVTAGWWIFARGRRLAKGRLPAMLPSFVFAAAAIVPWLARNVVLSGYPFFPAAVAGFPVDWRLPVEHAEGIGWWIRAYARMPEAWERMTAPGFAEWFRYWARVDLRASLVEALIPLVLAAVGALLAWILHRRRQEEEPRPPAALFIPFAAALPVWFLSAPSIRFVLFLFWCLSAQAVALVLPRLLAGPGVRRFLPALTLVWAVSPLVFQALYAVKYRGALTPRAALAGQFFTPPGPDHGFHPLFQPALDTVRVCGSLDVHLPAARVAVRQPAPWPETLPWDSPPPSTALLLPGLCLRQPGNRPENLATGFRIAGTDRPWAERNAAEVLAVAERTGWPLGRLAVYFVVRPEVIAESLELAGRQARP